MIKILVPVDCLLQVLFELFTPKPSTGCQSPEPKIGMALGYCTGIAPPCPTE